MGISTTAFKILNLKEWKMVYFDQAWWWTGSNLASAPCRFTLSPPYTGIIITCSVEIIFPGCRIIHKHAVNVHGTQNILYLFVLAMALHSLSRLWVSWMDVCSLPVTVKNGARKTCLQGKASGDAYQNFAPQTVQHLPTRFSTYLLSLFTCPCRLRWQDRPTSDKPSWEWWLQLATVPGWQCTAFPSPVLHPPWVTMLSKSAMNRPYSSDQCL